VASASDKAIITEAANRYGVRPDVLWGLYGEETGFGHNTSTSSAGAVGPFQFLPSTAKGMGVNPYEFKSAAFGAAKYLGQYKGRGLGGMLSAYNAGPAGAYQPEYVKGVENYAKSFGKAPSSVPQSASAALPGAPAKETSSFDQAGFQKAQRASLVGKLLASEGGSKDNPLFASGLVNQKTPSAAEFTTSTQGQGPPAQGEPQRPSSGFGQLGGFVPRGAQANLRRTDMGKDIQTNPGGPIVAPGDGEVIAVHNNPGGFGERYPVVKFTSGPLAGQSVYIGHTHSTLEVGAHFKAGQVISKTGYGTPKEGDARTPGWAEIGFSSALGAGNKGQGSAIAPYIEGKRR
jgi:murein DD-endopeptidase MepM/ murein hydrolase activator NlpD